MPSPRASGDVTGPYVHAAAVVRSERDLVRTATAFVREGLEAGDLVVVAANPVLQQVVAEEFGDEDGLAFDDRLRLNGRRAPDSVAAGAELAGRAVGRGSGRLRVLAQVDQSDDPQAVRELACFEAVSNVRPSAAPTAALCLYDERRLAPELVRTAAATHPCLLVDGSRRASDRYVEPREFVRHFPVPEDRLQAGSPALAIDDAPTLAGLRRALGDELARTVPDSEQRQDLHLALSEMAANAFRHGGRPVSARLWAGPDRLVCTISDAGGGLDPLRGYWPAHGKDLSRGGMGLWLARKLVDHVDLISTAEGTTVRLTSTLR